MLSFRLALVLSITAFAAVGCDPGPETSSATLPIGVTGGATGNVNSAGLSASPSGLAFSGIGLTTPILISSGAVPNTSLSVSGCSGIATTNGAIGFDSHINVSAIGVGNCTLRLANSAGSAVAISITVSSLTVPLN